MSQIFHRSTNTLSKVSIFGALFLAAGALWLVLEINRSPYVTQAGVARDQPVPFSHAAPRGRAGDRLPLLPHLGRGLGHRRHARRPRPA